MATIVRHKDSGRRFVLLGTGYGAFHSTTGHWLLGDHLPTSRQGSHPMVALCDAEGRLGWLPSDEVEVVSVDGSSPHELLPE